MSGPSKKLLTFTIFTPTFNRRGTLNRVFNSLCEQTYQDFEWLIVDDGSIDGTGEMVQTWIKESKLCIRYYWQKNQGKHIAFNYGVQMASGQLFLTLDSDDGCVPDALETLIGAWESIPETERYRFSAITALCMDEHGKLIGKKFKHDILDSDSLEIRYKYRITGEKWGFQRTDVLKEHPFPYIPGTKFVPESIVWSAIARKYKTRYINKILRIYYINTNSTDEIQLTNTGKPGKHSKSLMIWHRSILNNEIDWFRYNPAHFLISAIHYFRFSYHQSETAINALKRIISPLAFLLCIIAIPVGKLIYLRDLNRQ